MKRETDSFHREAMGLADKGLELKKSGDSEGAKATFLQAARLEMKAVQELDEGSFWKSVFLTSAGFLLESAGIYKVPADRHFRRVMRDPSVVKVHSIVGADPIPAFLVVNSETQPLGFVGVFLGNHVVFEVTEDEYSELVAGKTSLPDPLKIGDEVSLDTFFALSL